MIQFPAVRSVRSLYIHPVILRSVALGRAALLLALVALASGPAAASSGGTTGAPFLLLGTGSRTAALGQANAAWADDVYGMAYNPAGIATVGRQEVGFAYNALIMDLEYNYIGYVLPFRRGGTLGLSFQYVDLGSVERREVLAGGGPSGVLGRATAHDIAFSATYARTMTDFLDLGATVKVINETLDNSSASAVALDIGAKWRPPVPGLTFGVSLSNLGTRLKFVRANEDLPLTLRTGVGYRAPGGRWGVTGDVYYTREHDLEAGFGGEWWAWPEHVVLRAGVNTTTDEGSGLSLGAGFRWQDVTLDYAWVPFGELGDQNTVALAYQFGPVLRQPPTGGREARTQPSRAPSTRRPIEPAPAPTAPYPSAASAEPVLPTLVRPREAITRVAVGLVTEMGNGEVTSTGRQLTLALIQRLRERGIIVDPQADASFNGSYATLEDGRLAVYGRVRDRNTGRPLRGVKAIGYPDDVPGLITQLVSDFTAP